ncbi:hypothetical protein [Geodermatophilus sp. DSM 44513]|uniref:hypothetical protein n=1 Tax=Geodermatophilus sp. DSM 44513 TaxID=1528104 RepID=UPI0012812C22|nr:hypothetical protein [Geodermatophilus sp. DSM 44513]WNV73966.1 hypothetical protein RTG05_13315 [Geodermatophilus sp. DSM 44513]
MTLPLVVVLVVAVGLPLLAVWVARRPYWSRLRAGAEPDPWGDLVRRHGLSAGEASRIAEDVPRGRRLPDPRLRPVAVEWARELLRQEQLRLPRDPWRRRVVVAFLVVWLVTALGLVVPRVVSGEGVDVNWATVVIWSVVGIWAVRRRRALRRAVELNEGLDPDR